MVFVNDEVKARNEGSRWLRILPSATDPTRTSPLTVLRPGSGGLLSLFDADSPHLVAPFNRIGSALEPQTCHVHICGTGSNPTENNSATWFLSTTADRGCAAIGLSYEWGPLADLERNNVYSQRSNGNNNDIQDLLSKYHSDILFGGSESGLVEVPRCNSILGRLTSLLRYLLKTRQEEEGWKYFLQPGEGCSISTLSDDGEINFKKFIFSGHSQGSGHVCYLAKKVCMARAILLSGPQEYLDLMPKQSSGDINIGDSDILPTAESSWLDGPYATQDIRAFMHYDEEHTADLIRSNWSRIEPISVHYKKNYVDIESKQHPTESPSSIDNRSNASDFSSEIALTDDSGISDQESPEINDNGEVFDYNCSTFVDHLGRSYRTFYTRIVPSLLDLSAGRPNHMSTVCDRATPMKKISSASLPSNLLSILDHNSAISDVIYFPIYYLSIWQHLLEDVIPDEKLDNNDRTVSKL